MQIWKKWIGILTVSLLISCLPLSVVKANEGTVYDQYENKSQTEQKVTKQNPEPSKESVVPYALKFIGSFLLILFLLFIVLKYLSKKTKRYPGGGPFHALGGHSLGNNRSMQMLMIGDTLYILGVAENVNLIRTIPPGEEQKRLLEAMAERPIDTVSKWGAGLKKTSQEKWDELLSKQLKDVNSDADQQKKGENE
ncbi:flagellar biosynthetic protein FliO [Neobacillus niacini]|uniref:flagellar biosynthetic protein FliO n=1 Tax=Neobacillus niacini TaxID=86668 RepID=UPI002FFF9D50